jgi:hypothetical protein
MILLILVKAAAPLTGSELAPAPEGGRLLYGGAPYAGIELSLLMRSR